MRTYPALVLGCILITGCSGGTPSVPPTRSTDSLSQVATTGSAYAQKLFVGTLNYAAWYDESSLALAGRGAYERSTPNDIRFALTPSFNRAYVAFPQENNIAGNHVLEFNGTTHTVSRAIPVGTYDTVAVAVTPDDRKLYVGVYPLNQTTAFTDSVLVIDLATEKVLKKIPLPVDSDRVWMTADHSGQHVYVFSYNENGPDVLTQIAAVNDSITYNNTGYPTEMSISGVGNAIAVSPDDRTLNFSGDKLYAVDTASGSVLATVAGTPGGNEGFTALDEAKTGSTLYAAKYITYVKPGTPPTNTLVAFDARTLAVKGQATLSGLTEVSSIAAASSGNVFLNADLLSNANSWVLRAVNPATGRVLNSITAPRAVNIYAQ